MTDEVVGRWMLHAHPRCASLLAEGEGTPVLSGNMRHLASKPGQVGISGCFMQTRPLFVTSGLDTLTDALDQAA